jgi:hypothetical protein
VNRLRSLDVFRGATVALMILVNNPGSWSHIYPPLAHAPWHGATPTDLVFPFFLFAVGNALALVLPRLREQPPTVFWRKAVVRTALIFGIGLLLNAAPFVHWDSSGALVVRDWQHLRLMGVLQRIGLCFGAAAVLVWLGGMRGALWATAALLIAYWAACVAWVRPATHTAWPVGSARRSTAPYWVLRTSTAARACRSIPKVWPARPGDRPGAAGLVGRRDVAQRRRTRPGACLAAAAPGIADAPAGAGLAPGDADQQEDLDIQLRAADHRPGDDDAGRARLPARSARSSVALGAAVRSLRA